MATGLFDKGREGFLNKLIDWGVGSGGDDIRGILIDTDTDAPVLATDDFLDDIAAGARIAVSSSFDGKTVTAGVADANDVTFPTVSGASVEGLLIYSHTGGADSARRLVAFIDSGGATGLPLNPNGGDVIAVFSSGANKIFKL